MFARIRSWFGGVMGRVRGIAGGVATVLALGVFSGTVRAQTAVPIPLETPNIAWDALPSTLIGVLTTPVVVGIGIALSIWVILKAMTFFKRAA
jgi:hypothetical protein